ncbi:MAG: TrmH family RNA methyltransferase [Rubripirellula sp.]
MDNCIELEDLDDPRLAAYANLKHSNSARQRNSFVVEGRWCVERLLASSFQTESILLPRGKESEFAGRLPDQTTIYSLRSEAINDLVGYKFHRGVLACGRRQALLPVDQLRFSQQDPAIALAVIGVSEHENLGSIIRSASALGIGDILIGPGTIDPFSRRVIRVSMATVFSQRLFDLRDPIQQLPGLTADGTIRTIVTTLDSDATCLEHLSPDNRNCLLVVGNEATGVPVEIQQLAADRVTIPMHLGTDSLNVAVAAAIFMHELCRWTRSIS